MAVRVRTLPLLLCGCAAGIIVVLGYIIAMRVVHGAKSDGSSDKGSDKRASSASGGSGTSRTAQGQDPWFADPRLTYQTRLKNVRPDVKYIGDQACISCHEKENSDYHGHPMSRSAWLPA